MGTDNDPRPPLPEWILDAFDVLVDNATGVNADGDTRSITRDRAIEVLLSTDDLSLEREETTYALTRLLERGYFYEVDDELRVTSSET